MASHNDEELGKATISYKQNEDDGSSVEGMDINEEAGGENSAMSEQNETG